MLKTKEDRRKAVVVIILFFIAWWGCRFPPFNVSTIHYLGAALGFLRPLIYIGFCLAWGVYISQTIINKRLKVYLQWIAIYCIFWLFLRTVKYELVIKGSDLASLLVELYYIPFVLIPTFAFFASLYARRGESYKIPKAIYISVLSISIVAIVIVLTNPLHKLYWVQTPDDDLHGPAYIIVIAWTILLFIMAIINIIVRSKVPGKNKVLVWPIIVLAIIIIYFLTAFLLPDIWKIVSSDWTSFTCLATIAMFQACISTGMLPSNKGYAKIFEASSKGAIITDKDFNICYASAGAEKFSKEILEKTKEGVLKIDKNTLLKGGDLNPGYLVWKEDISAISALIEELDHNRKELLAKNEIDRESNMIELELSRAEEKNRLHDLSEKATAKQKKILQETLFCYFQEVDSDTRKELLIKASLLASYIKRKGNLVFVGDGGLVKASELELSFKESLSNLDLLQTSSYMSFSLSNDENIPIETALLLYDTFERSIEATLADIEAVFLRIFKEEGEVSAIYSIVSSKDLSFVDFPKEAKLEKDGDTWIISISLSKLGGDD